MGPFDKYCMTGFIYLWYDRKHKRFYLGKHWGAEDDGYICSSKWMKRAYARRPEDFKRRIIERVSDRNLLAEAERNWGLLIKEHEYRTRYYNLTAPGGNQWHDNPNTYAPICEKISVGTKAAMQRPDVRANYEAGLKKRRGLSPEAILKRNAAIKESWIGRRAWNQK